MVDLITAVVTPYLNLVRRCRGNHFPLTMEKMSCPQSPCSPKRRTRQQEKEELQHLNDRFVTYIDRVRRIREENESKEFQITHLQNSTEQETISVKRVYESELQDARTLIDETAKEKARYQILASKHLERVEELEQE